MIRDNGRVIHVRLRESQCFGSALTAALSDMNSAFLLSASNPAPTAFVLTGGYLASAWPTADAGVTIVVKFVVRQVVFGNVAPNL